MNDFLGMQPDLVVSVLAIVFGVLILVAPKLLNYLVAIYLLFFGIIGVWPHLFGGAPAPVQI